MNKLAKLREILTEQDIDAVLISSVPNITYLTAFSSFSPTERDAYLFITKTEQYILTNALYAEAVKRDIQEFTLLQLTGTGPLTTHLKSIIAKEHITKVGIEPYNLTVAEYERVSSVLPEVFDCELSTLRLIKSEEEVEKIKKACHLGDTAFSEVIQKIKPGMTEKQVAFSLEMYIKEHGGDLSFPTIVAFGEHAVTPHHHTGMRKLQENDLILIDFGVLLDNYCSDMTRTVCIGNVSEKLQDMYKTTLTSQQKAVEYIEKQLEKDKPVSAYATDKAARDYIISKGYPSIPHSLGHGIGIEVHESPSLSYRSKEVLENGMVFSIEPGIYLPTVGGIRIEDLYTIQEDALIQLTKSPTKLTK